MLARVFGLTWERGGHAKTSILSVVTALGDVANQTLLIRCAILNSKRRPWRESKVKEEYLLSSPFYKALKV